MKAFSIIKLLSFLLTSIPLLGQSQAVYFERLIPESNGNSLPVIHCISQTSQGFVWITSPYGLARFDGNDFLMFQHKEDDSNSLIDNYLFSVLEDSKGNLWFTSDKGLELLDKKTGRFIHFQQDLKDSNTLPSNHLRSIAEDKEGYLWIGTLDAGICRFDHKSKAFKQYMHDPTNPQSPSSNSIWAIYCDRKGSLWIGTHEGLLDCYDMKHDRWTHHNLLPIDYQNIDDPNIWDLFEGQDGKIWIGTASVGLVSLNPDSGSIDRIHLRKNKGNLEVDYMILSLLQDQEGIIWMGTRNSGVFSYNPVNKTLQQYTVNTTKPGSLSDNTVITVFEDREGLLWFGTNKGISILNKKKFRFPLVEHNTQSPGELSGSNIKAMYEDREGLVWISTALGGLNIWDKKNDVWNQSDISKKVLESFRINPINAICEDSQGNLWFGNNKGLYVYERQNNTITLIHNTMDNKAVPKDFAVKTMAQGRNNSIWIGTNKGELLRWDTKNRKAHFYPNPQQKLNKNWYIINSAYVDSKGGVWMGTQWHGVDFFDPQSRNWLYYRHKTKDPNSLPNSTVYSITEDNTGKIWIGTEAGPCFLDPKKQKWHHMAEEMRLPDYSAYGLIIDKSNWIWMSTDVGLIQFEPQSLRWRIFGPEDGLQDRIFNPGVCFKSRNGEMYFGGISGFNHFYPDEIQANPLPPLVAITSFQTATQKKQTHILQGVNSLEITKKDLPIIIKMAALSFAFPQKNHYLVRSFDIEPTENYLGPHNSFVLRDLKRGKNRFLIQASNHDLIWNDTGVELTITLTTPIFRSWYLLVFTLIVAAAASWYLYKYRRRLGQKKSIIEIQKDISILIKRFKLTKREQEIIVLVLQGKTNRNIQKELFISLKTVKSHLYNIYRKFKVHNRLQLMNTIKDYLTKNQSAEK